MLLMYMPATRTQIYLTEEQRVELDRIVRRRGVTLAAVVREAVARYLADSEPDLGEALASTFGSMPDLEVPSREEWDAGPADRH
jgi:Ribbon-helix-helix protein, copG family